MFRQLVALNIVPVRDLVQLHPSELNGLLELVWNTVTGGPVRGEQRLLGVMLPSTGTTAVDNLVKHLRGLRSSVAWDHLIYAYMVENTGIYEVFQRVVLEFVQGEKLGPPTDAGTPAWLRNTEELFYRDLPSFSISALTSYVRPDLRATRRNAYYRMFGMDLNHGGENNQPYRYTRPDAANKEFVPTFEELLREVWIGITFLQATAIPRLTDDARLLTLVDKLKEMLNSRRQGGNLAREEFFAVAMMSWLHLVVETEPALPIVVDLKATVPGNDQRLFQIAQRVGYPAHGLSKSYLDIADAISRILRLIESGVITGSGVQALYVPGTSYPAPLNTAAVTIENDMRTIINHWSTISGRDMKARKVSST